LAENSLRTKADRVRQGIPDIDNPACKKVLANTLSTPCLVQFANMIMKYSAGNVVIPPYTVTYK